MENINWSGYEWIPRERWGILHPDKAYCWYDPSAVNITEDNVLELRTLKNPRYFEELDVTVPIGIGMMSCTEKFGYGTFEIEAKLPKGKRVWPAFWMWSWDSWPPEIDVFEGYTSRFGSYFKFRLLNPLGFWNLQTNEHSIPDKKAQTHWFGFKNPAKHFMKYKLEWFPDVLNFYFDGKLVRTITDQIVLDKLRDTKMNVVINNSTQKETNPNGSLDGVFEIKYFTYKKY